MSGPGMEQRRAARRARRGVAWLAYAGTALILLALLRWSVNNFWDPWCTVSAVLGAVAIGAWGARQHGLLQRFRSRGVQYGSQAVISSLLLFVALALVNFIANRHNRSFDLTEAGLWTLSSQTRQVLRNLPRDVRLLAFFPSGRRAQAADLLRRYAEASPRLSYELIDPDQDPERAQRYGVTAYGTVVVLASPAPGQAAHAGPPIRVEAEAGQGKSLLLSEEKLTNALLKVDRGGAKTLYFLEGHGEPDIDDPQANGFSGIRHTLDGQSFLVKRLNLAHEKEVPGDCSVLIIAHPRISPLPAEVAAIDRFLQHGGKAMVMVDPAPGDGLQPFLDHWGVRVGDDVIMDVSGAGQSYGFGPAMPLVNTYDGRLPIGKDFHLNTFFPLARSLMPKDNTGDAQVLPLAQTGPDSFAEPYHGGARRVAFDPQRDRKGPILVAVAVTREAKSGKQARIVVTGSSRFVSNRFLGEGGNTDYFLRCMNWLAEEEELIAIQPRSAQDRRVALTEQQARGIFWLIVVAMPLAAMALGIAVHWRRRSG
jgi:ABC-type uncharacterized transport system involved in gliding motility auxiliary subunit